MTIRLPADCSDPFSGSTCSFECGAEVDNSCSPNRVIADFDDVTEDSNSTTVDTPGGGDAIIGDGGDDMPMGEDEEGMTTPPSDVPDDVDGGTTGTSTADDTPPETTCLKPPLFRDLSNEFAALDDTFRTIQLNFGIDVTDRQSDFQAFLRSLQTSNGGSGVAKIVACSMSSDVFLRAVAVCDGLLGAGFGTIDADVDNCYTVGFYDSEQCESAEPCAENVLSPNDGPTFTLDCNGINQINPDCAVTCSSRRDMEEMCMKTLLDVAFEEKNTPAPGEPGSGGGGANGADDTDDSGGGGSDGGGSNGEDSDGRNNGGEGGDVSSSSAMFPSVSVLLWSTAALPILLL